MGNLGKLWFELGLKDLTDKDIKSIEKRLKDLNVQVGLNGQSLKSSIENALRGQQFKIDVVVDKANTTKLIQDAIAKAGINTNVSASDVRAERAIEIQKRVQNAYNESQKRIEKLQAQIDKLRSSQDRASSSANKQAGAINGITKNLRTQFNIAAQLRNQLAGIYSVYAAERFLTQIIKIGGEFQQQRVALQTMFQDATKADVLFGQIKELAVISPFEFKELAGYTKQLAAFNIPYEEMYDTTKRLADISAGVGVDMGRIILAYGQVRSAEFLKGTELRQFTEAGIPLLQKLADKFTLLEGRVVSVGEVFDKISKREVSFQMVKDVLWDLTNEGGQFYNMQGALADTLAGKLANLRDAYDVMLADIAQSNNSTLSKGLDLITDTMNHWDKLSKYVLSAAVSYGSYKAALMAVWAIEKARNLYGSIRLVMMFRKELGLLTAAQRAFNITASVNPYVAIATILATAAGSMILFSDRAKSTQEVITDLNESLGKMQTKFEESKGMEKLIDEYEQLSNKQNKTAEESKRLESVTSSLRAHFKGAAMDVKAYTGELEMSVKKMREANEESLEMAKTAAKGNLRDAEKREAELEKRLEAIKNKYKAGTGTYIAGATVPLVFSRTEEDLEKYAEEYIDIENQLIAAQKATKKAREEFENLGKTAKDTDLGNTLSGWRKAIGDFISGNDRLKNLMPKDAEEYADWLKRFKNELSEAKDELARKEKTTGLFPDEDIKAARKRVQELQSVVDKFNLSIKEKKEKGKDPIAEKFQKQVDLIKAAMDAYYKYVSVLGKEGATKKVNEDTRFAGLNFDPDKVKESLQSIQSELQKVMGDNKARIKVNDNINKIYTDIDLKDVKMSTEKALAIIRRTIDENTARWNLYKELFGITGNRETSMRFAFGIDSSSMEGIYTQVDYLKKELLDLTGRTYDELKNLSDKELKDLLGSTDDAVKNLLGQIRNTTQQESEDIIKDVLQLVQKYASANDKIKSLESQREAKLKELRESNFYKGLSEEDKNTAENAVFKEYAKQIQEIQEESIKLSPIWQKLFGDTAALGYSNMRKVVDEAKKMIESVEEVKEPKTGESQYTISYKDKDGKIKKTTLSLETYLKLIKQVSKEERSLNEQNPFKGIKDSLDKYNKALSKGDEDDKKAALSSLGQYANEAAHMVSSLTNAWSDMFGVLGNEGAADTLSFAGDILGELGSLAQGLTSGNPIQMATSALSFIPNIVSKIAQFHDKKLDRAIQKSALEVQKLENAYTNLEKIIERQLGEVSKKQTDEMIRNLQRQRQEVEKQMQAEEDKKKTDKSKIENYKQQIAELDDQLKYFYEDLAKDLYGIDLKDFASNIANSLVDAFASGEDAAEAFDKTVADIMKNVLKNVLQTRYIETAMESLREYLFGKNGKGGILGDGNMSDSDMAGLVSQLAGLKNTIGESQKVWDYLNEAAKQAGITLTDESANAKKNGLSQSAKGITEDQADVFGSYLNAIRHDVSVKRNLLENIAGTLLPTMSITAQAQLQQLNAIADNTKINADAAVEIKKSATVIQESLSSVITQGKDGKAIRIK